MKSLLISTAASWGTSIRTWVDGNILRESNCDLIAGDIADRLGYLKNALDAKVNLAGSNTLTGLTTWAAGAAPGIVVNGDQGITTNTLDVSALATFTSDVQVTTAGTLTIDGPVTVSTFGQLRLGVTTLNDAAQTIPSGGYHFRVPQITANRVYTLPASTGGGRTIKLERLRTADSFTATLQTSGAVVMGVVPVSANGFIEVVDGPTGWVVSSFSNTISSVSQTV